MQPELEPDRRCRQKLTVKLDDIGLGHSILHGLGFRVLHLLRRHMADLNKGLQVATIPQAHTASKLCC